MVQGSWIDRYLLPTVHKVNNLAIRFMGLYRNVDFLTMSIAIHQRCIKHLIAFEDGFEDRAFLGHALGDEL